MEHEYHWDDAGNITHRRTIANNYGDELQGDEGDPDPPQHGGAFDYDNVYAHPGHDVGIGPPNHDYGDVGSQHSHMSGLSVLRGSSTSGSTRSGSTKSSSKSSGISQYITNSLASEMRKKSAHERSGSISSLSSIGSLQAFSPNTEAAIDRINRSMKVPRKVPISQSMNVPRKVSVEARAAKKR